MTRTPVLPYWPPATDTADLGWLWRQELAPPTAALHPVFDLPPVVEPTRRRLPSWVAAAGAFAATAAGVTAATGALTAWAMW